jgi:hypothetical protein
LIDRKKIGETDCPRSFFADDHDEGEISISKEVLPELPDGYEETILGKSRGCKKQFRHPSGVHVREYADRFVIHKDNFDPRFAPLSHIVSDAPCSAVALGLASIFAWKALVRREKRRRLKEGE